MEQHPQKLLDQAGTELRSVRDAVRFILFHGKRHPQEMGVPEIQAFLTHLAVDEHAAASTQNQALSALLFLYRQVLRQDLDGPLGALRASRPTPSPPTCWKVTMTSTRSRNCWATRTSRRPGSTPTCSTGGAWRCAARWIDACHT